MQSTTRTKLEQDLGDLLESGSNSDLVILCQGEEIKAHRTILSARSPIFCVMLQAGMVEDIAVEVITVEDTKVVILRQLLLFLYTVRLVQDFQGYQG